MTYLEKYKAEHPDEEISDDFIECKHPCWFYREIVQVCLFEEHDFDCNSCWNQEVVKGERIR